MARHPGEPNLPACRPARYPRLEVALMAAVSIVGAIGLAWLSFRVTSWRHGASADDHLRRVEPVHWEATWIFTPESFVEIAKIARERDMLDSHEDVCRCLQDRGQAKAWYAIIYRVLQSDGNVLLMPVYCRPNEAPWKAWEFQAVLATLQGNPPRLPHTDFSNVKVSIIPEKLAAPNRAWLYKNFWRARSLSTRHQRASDGSIVPPPSPPHVDPKIGKAGITRGTAPSAGMWSRVTPSNPPSMA